ncbi:GH32 C-terminal domain-containing protein [Microbacterium proteolyticum]|uniref:GH32 C-terminal domain-containing protein n=1 Tax=Microbacterium proteolyticum TaxID=1572644 RepID=UPI0027D8CB71|nr:GH32 C-terminal domain-containing protein [Microbacterium proteolyticum]
MNDPNGMVFHKGVYHLYFQHNPYGDRWGNMSWGHATSTDLLTWTEQPLAIPQTLNEQGQAIESIFSGSVVVDENNTSGFGDGTNPPLIAVYTSAYEAAHPTHAGLQAQSLAYSLDDGYTWTKYEQNPVLDRGSANFRDPKVFWYDGPGGAYWVMAAVEALDHKVVLYKSTNLKDWDYLSDFGPANSTGGIWECPDLFELPVDGDPNNTKWVMVVNLNPGAVGGGSGGQYFVGEFDGTTFTSESTQGAQDVPAGEVSAGFDDGTFDGWTVGNEPGNWKDGPWGLTPASGALEGQSAVTGFVGPGLVNGFHDGDWPVGTLESPTFTVSDPYINLLVGGGRHPHVDGTQLTNDPPAGTTVFDFELPDGQTLADSGWQLTGDFATDPARNPSTAGGDYYLGAKRINTWEGGPRGDDNTGEMLSPAFELNGDYVSFLIGGGKRTDGTLQAELVVDGQVVRSQTGPEAGALNWVSWDAAEFAGKQAQIRIRDEATGGWGHLTFDHVVVGDTPAQVRSDETSVNLVVDGEIVRTATGANSENLDWASWNVAEFTGRQASIRVIDNNRFGWGHILLDQVMFADQAAPTRLESYDWLDWGRDYYATVTYSGTPDTDSRVMQGWMNNWDYANDIPTSPWRSSMALPREVALTATAEGPRLTQKVVPQIDGQLDATNAQTRTNVAVDGPTDLQLSGDVVKVDLTLRPGDAAQAGITVFGDDTSGTRIGYDTTSGRVFVDRRDSGNVDFHPAFASVEDAPVALADGTVTVEAYLDRASVELFAAGGRTTITDQVFPNAEADRISAWSEGGTAVIERISVTPLIPTMWKNVEAPGAPTAVTATPQTGGATVSWTAPAGDGGSPVTEYRVYQEGVDAAVATTTSLTASVTGLKPGTTARFAVTAVNSAGESAKSEWSAPVTVPDGAKAKPGKAKLWHDNLFADGDYAVKMTLLKGENATVFRLYENGTLIATVPLEYRGTAPQSAKVEVSGKKNGTYVYTGELANSKGVTATTSTTVKVTKALPATPVLTHDNRDGDGAFTLTATLRSGTNATSYRFPGGRDGHRRGRADPAHPVRADGPDPGHRGECRDAHVPRRVHQRRRHDDEQAADGGGAAPIREGAGADARGLASALFSRGGAARCYPILLFGPLDSPSSALLDLIDAAHPMDASYVFSVRPGRRARPPLTSWPGGGRYIAPDNPGCAARFRMSMICRHG